MYTLKRVALTVGVLASVAAFAAFAVVYHWESAANEFTAPAPPRPVDILVTKALEQPGLLEMVTRQPFTSKSAEQQERILVAWSHDNLGEEFDNLTEADQARLARRIQKSAERLVAQHGFKVHTKR